jgi:serine/threonine-protein kinase
MYELLAGKRPWDGNSEVALIGKIMTEEPQPLAELRPDAPPELLGVIEKALSKDRDQRFQTCQEMQAELEQVLVGMAQSVTAARVADFVRAYAPEQQAAGAATTGVEGADLSILEEQAFGGTGAAPALVGPNAAPQPPPHQSAETATHNSGTSVMEGDERLPPPPKSNAWKYGVGAFVSIAAIGGAAVFFLHDRNEEPTHVVAVERSSIAANDKPADPPKPVEAPKPVEPPKAEPPKPVEAPKVEPHKEARPEPRPRKKDRLVAVVKDPPKEEPKAPPPPVVIIKKEEPKAPPPPPPPTVIAKGELIIIVRPWAKVWVDDKEVGQTPLPSAVSLSAGPHKVRLVNPDLKKDVTRTVTVSANARDTLKEIFEE